MISGIANLKLGENYFSGETPLCLRHTKHQRSATVTELLGGVGNRGLFPERCNRSRPSYEFTSRGGLEHLSQLTTQVSLQKTPSES
jgi:hypothetical protein